MKIIGPYQRFFIRLSIGNKTEWFVSRWCVKTKYLGGRTLETFTDKAEAEQRAVELRRAAKCYKA